MHKFDRILLIITIKKLLKNMKIPLNLIGYLYIVEALENMISSGDIVFLNQIYIEIAERHKTTPACVEIGIRNIISKCVKNNTSNLFKILDIPPTIHISNSVFLNSAKEIILEKLMEKSIK